MKMIVTPEVRALGIDAVAALVGGVNLSNKSGPLEKRQKEVIEQNSLPMVESIQKYGQI